jgi:hypothetical protein
MERNSVKKHIQILVYDELKSKCRREILTSSMCASSRHRRHLNAPTDHCCWPECSHFLLHQEIPVQVWEKQSILFLRALHTSTANANTCVNYWHSRHNGTRNLANFDKWSNTVDACLVLFVLDAFHSPGYGVCYCHGRSLVNLHSVCVSFDKLAKNFRFCVLGIPKIHHLVEKLILQSPVIEY